MAGGAGRAGRLRLLGASYRDAVGAGPHSYRIRLSVMADPPNAAGALCPTTATSSPTMWYEPPPRSTIHGFACASAFSRSPCSAITPPLPVMTSRLGQSPGCRTACRRSQRAAPPSRPPSSIASRPSVKSGWHHTLVRSAISDGSASRFVLGAGASAGSPTPRGHLRRASSRARLRTSRCPRLSSEAEYRAIWRTSRGVPFSGTESRSVAFS